MRTCKVDGCNGKHKGLGYCDKHYQQFKIHGKLSIGTEHQRQVGPCSVDGCDVKATRKGFCGRHYKHFRQHGYVPERNMFDKNQIVIIGDAAVMTMYHRDCSEHEDKVYFDADRINEVREYKWSLTSTGYAHRVIGKIKIQLHNFLFDMNIPDGFVVDHVDRNPRNCRSSNLRLASSGDNVCNRMVFGEIGIKGIVRRPSGRFAARITKNGVMHWLGTFDTINEALASRRAAAFELHGEFACETKMLPTTATGV